MSDEFEENDAESEESTYGLGKKSQLCLKSLQQWRTQHAQMEIARVQVGSTIYE